MTRPTFFLPDGTSFVLDHYKHGSKRAYTRWICTCKVHDGCTRKRGVALSKTHGKLEPLAFLAVWASNASLDNPAHDYDPSADDVASWIEHRSTEFLAQTGIVLHKLPYIN